MALPNSESNSTSISNSAFVLCKRGPGSWGFSSQNVDAGYSQHPDHEPQSDHGYNEVPDPLTEGLRFSPVFHAVGRALVLQLRHDLIQLVHDIRIDPQASVCHKHLGDIVLALALAHHGDYGRRQLRGDIAVIRQVLAFGNR